MNREIKSMELFVYALFLLVLTAELCNADEDFDAQKRAGGSVGLFPFPRVGRSDPDLTSEWSQFNSFENYDELGRHEMKRQGLVPFPRVGRSGGYNPRFYQQYSDYNKRSQGVNPHWFGPRLGRAGRDQENEVFTPRLGRSIKTSTYQNEQDHAIPKNLFVQGYDDTE